MTKPDAVSLHDVIDDLPTDFSDLQADALQEGFRFIERLVDDWRENVCRFDKASERLLIVRSTNRLAGVGGLTIDPYDRATMRMRRFYVRPGHRRSGMGRLMVADLIRCASQSGALIKVNAATPKGPAFWESLGFIPVEAEGHTHVYERRPDPRNSQSHNIY